MGKSCNYQSLGSLDIFKIFAEVQWTKAYHDKYIKELKKIYQATPFKVFETDFLKCLKQVLCCSETKLPNVDLTLEFAARFTVSVGETDEETCPFLQMVFNFLFENQDCYHNHVRLQICKFINRLLNNLGANASLDEEICERITTTMTGRLLDKVATVRTQAVNALNRLQDPKDENCQIIKVFLYHLVRDPNADVRCAIINKIVITKKTLTAILSRLYDVKDIVRRDALLVCSKLLIQSFSIKQRQNIINIGLLDPSEQVRNCFKDTLLPKWLSLFKNDYVEFCRALNIQAEAGLDVACKCLLVFFKKEEKLTLIEYMQTKLEERTIPHDKLTPELVLFWRELTNYFHPDQSSDDGDEFFEQIVPELSFFVEYIRGFAKLCIKKEQDAMKTVTNEFILIQLMEMTKVYDLADEVGRVNLSQLCTSLLKDPNITAKSVPIIVKRLNWSMPEVNERIATIVEAISDLREPYMVDSDFEHMKSVESEKNRLKERLEALRKEQLEASLAEDMMVAKHIDLEIAYVEEKLAKLEQDMNNTVLSEVAEENIDPVVLAKCLLIVKGMVDSKDVTRMTPTLRSLLDNFVLPAFQKNLETPAVRILSLEALGMFCLLEAELAKRQFLVFCFLISTEPVTALKIVFDLLLTYGLKMFNVKEETLPAEEGKKKKSSIQMSKPGVVNDYLISLLITLLESQSKEVRTLTTEGLCKLYLVGQLRSPYLIARLFALWFSPESAEDPQWRQSFGMFLKAFLMTFGSHIILEKAFMPTLQLFFNAPVDSPLAEVNIDSVAQVLLKLTHPDVSSFKDYCVHNNLVKQICTELSEKNQKHERSVLMRALTLLSVRSTNPEFFDDLIDFSDKLMHKSSNLGDKTCYRYAVKFSVMMKEAKQEAELKLADSEICNTLKSTNSSKESTIARPEDNETVFKVEDSDNSNSPIADDMKIETESTDVQVVASQSDSQRNETIKEEDEMDTSSIASGSICSIFFRKQNKTGESIIIPGSDDEINSQASETTTDSNSQRSSIRRSSRRNTRSSRIVIPCYDDDEEISDQASQGRMSERGLSSNSIQDEISSQGSQDSVFSTPSVSRRKYNTRSIRKTSQKEDEETSATVGRSTNTRTRSVKKTRRN